MLNFHSRKFRNRTIIVFASVAAAAVIVCGTVFGGKALAGVWGAARTKPAGTFHKLPSSHTFSHTSSARKAAFSSSRISSALASSDPISSMPHTPISSTLPASSVSDKGRHVYMTFDDGPSSLTKPLLDVLDRYGVKATFFVVGRNDGSNLTADLQDIARRGHVLAVHSYTHDYHQIYASSEAFFQDFDKMHSIIQSAAGIDTKICRLPGGSVNGYNGRTRKAILAGLKQRGYVYYDWNASSGDAGGPITSQGVVNNALSGVHAHHNSVVLFHNTSAKQATLKAIPHFIETLQKEGYRFCTLDPSVNNGPYIF